MAKPYNISILNGEGSAEVLNGSYSVTSSTNGYVDSSIDPSTLNVVEGTNSYNLKIAAEGNLTLHVTEDGTTSGIAVVGAKFIRCDSLGTTYGSEFVTDENGNAVITNVPFAASNAPEVFYKQTSSDGEHEFDDTLKSVSLDTSSKTVEVINTKAVSRTFTLTDANYDGLKIASGSITLN